MGRLLTTKELCARLGGASESTIRYWRMINYGPKGFRVGRRVLYDETEVENWLRQQAATEGVGSRGGAA